MEAKCGGKMVKQGIIIVILFLLMVWPAEAETISFEDDFRHGAGQWEFFAKKSMTPLPGEGLIIDSGDKEHGKVLSLPPGDLIALIKYSESWSNYKVEGDVCFPNTEASLMGLIYNFDLQPRPNLPVGQKANRTEFGSMYIKCGGSYIRVNPHYDGTAGRALYDDYKTPLTGDAAVRLKQWKHFKFEVVGGACHLYVGDMEKPKVTFNHYHRESGRVGFRPRTSGSECWIDNINITSIEKLSFDGTILPEGVKHQREELLTRWHAVGPFLSPVKEIERDQFDDEKVYTVKNVQYKWMSFEADHRGCVISGRINDFVFPFRMLSYYYTAVKVEKSKVTSLKFSSRSHLTVYVNGKLAGTIQPVVHIWPDFWSVGRHPATDISIAVKEGINHILVLVRGGKYPGDGFYAYYAR